MGRPYGLRETVPLHETIVETGVQFGLGATFMAGSISAARAALRSVSGGRPVETAAWGLLASGGVLVAGAFALGGASTISANRLHNLLVEQNCGPQR